MNLDQCFCLIFKSFKRSLHGLCVVLCSLHYQTVKHRGRPTAVANTKVETGAPIKGMLKPFRGPPWIIDIVMNFLEGDELCLSLKPDDAIGSGEVEEQPKSIEIPQQRGRNV